MISICRAERSDAETILELQKIAYESEARLYNDWSIPPLTQSVASLLEDFESHVILKAVQDGRIVGSVRAKVRNGKYVIGRLFVHPAYQGQGIGSMLLGEIEKSAPASVSRCELFTGCRSEANLRLYVRHGYTVTRTESLSLAVTLTFLEKPIGVAR
ncbi:MAG: GNAT family N-acetyltransferase [Desulfobulbus sp.]|jgi:ribosomal protein S18 acetylase RimI-like enzyme